MSDPKEDASLNSDSHSEPVSHGEEEDGPSHPGIDEGAIQNKIKKHQERAQQKNERIQQLKIESEALKEENAQLKEQLEQKEKECVKEKENSQRLQALCNNQKTIIEELKKQIKGAHERNVSETDNSMDYSQRHISTFANEPTEASQNGIYLKFTKFLNKLESLGLKQDLEKLTSENTCLKELIKKEQDEKIRQFKDSMELAIRIQSFEEEVAKSQQERYQLALDLDKISGKMKDLYAKIKESDEICNTCVSFLEKNGLIQTSFISDDGVLW
ncbi:unnamed protein product [Moneuplotes crassus]|uniref:Uncharacterized protein n=1 Tax=Euplotes crassus TaxID=5936 RepID=A0AAD1XIH0_EUPCR|nr:unnamed protein product [Moneuplotes crassus]